VDGESRYRPRSIIRGLTILLLAVSLAACAPRQPGVTLALLGDLILGRGVSPTSDSLSYLSPYLSTADLALANLESPLAPGDVPAAPTDGYNLCASSAQADLLAAWGLDLLSLANNHRDDCAPNGVTQTQSVLTSTGLTGLPPGNDPVIRQINGLRLAFLAFDAVTSPLEVEAAAQAVRSARGDGELVIVSIHWGMEYQGGASERQEFLAQQLAGAGATLVWGHHPHVLQPAEWLHPPVGSDPAGGSTLVLYSLGNALFDQGALADTRQSALVLITLDAQGVTKVDAVPFEIDLAQSRAVAPDPQASERILQRLRLPQ